MSTKTYLDNEFIIILSDTTRDPRPGEVRGKDYHFVTHDVMKKMIDNGEFLEHAVFGKNTYGTSKQSVKDICTSGKICVLDIELQGVRNIKKANLSPTPKYILIQAPSIDVLVSIFSNYSLLFFVFQRQRLIARGSESPESIDIRIKHAEEDLEAVKQDPDLFDYIIVNDDLDRAYEEFIKAVEHEIEEIQQMKKTNGS